VNADAGNVVELAGAIAGNDAVVSPLLYVGSDPTIIVDALKRGGIKRYVVVGGAGSLEVAPGKNLVDQPTFPAEYRAELLKARDFLNVLRGEAELDWTYLSPSAEFDPGLRTGKFRLGHDQLLVDTNGKSSVSMEDFAIAVVDELEKPAHITTTFHRWLLACGPLTTAHQPMRSFTFADNPLSVRYRVRMSTRTWFVRSLAAGAENVVLTNFSLGS
jgi:uncharacterized protein